MSNLCGDDDCGAVGDAELASGLASLGVLQSL